MPVLNKLRPLRTVLCVVVVLAVAAAVFFYVRFDPSDSVWFPKCPFLMFTGLECPGCGSQRALHALFHLDIGGAFRHNALMVVLMPFLAVLAAAEALKHRFPRFHEAVTGRGVVWTVFGVIVLWWVLRNVFPFSEI